MNYRDKWRSWIHVCLISARAFVLLNGSPSEEFQLQSGHRQVHPLSLLIFIFVIEGLHVVIHDAIGEGMFKGDHIDSLHSKLSYFLCG